MSYFSADFMKFMRALTKNNDREWFKEHKADFERHVKGPFEEFVGEMIHRIQALDSNVVLEPKDAIFRVHRDTRFSKDKTPYKTYVSAVFTRTGRKDLEYPSIYLQLGAKELGIAGGAHRAEKENLLAIRRAIQADPARFKRIINAKRFKEFCGELRGDKNKLLPAEFKGDAERIPWLANKQFYYWASHPGKEALRGDLPEFVMKHYRASQPLNAFLKQAIGMGVELLSGQIGFDAAAFPRKIEANHGGAMTDEEDRREIQRRIEPIRKKKDRRVEEAEYSHKDRRSGKLRRKSDRRSGAERRITE